MQDQNDKLTKAVQIKVIHDLLNGNNNKYRFDIENLNNNKRDSSSSPHNARSHSSRKSESRTKTSSKKKKKKSKKNTSSASKMKIDHCRVETSEELQPLDEDAPNLSSYQKVVDRVFNTQTDKMANKLTCLCTMNCLAMLVPKANTGSKSAEEEDELIKRMRSGGCGNSDRDSGSLKKTRSTADDDDDSS